MILFSGNYIWIVLPMTHQVTFLRKFSKDKNLLEKAGLSIRKAEAHWRGSISQSPAIPLLRPSLVLSQDMSEC